MDNNDKKRKGIGGFLDWVNADAGLPSLEELEHDAHGHEDSHDEPAYATDHASLAESDAEEPSADYAVFAEDEEMEYPDPVVAEDDLAEAVAVEVEVTEAQVGNLAVTEMEVKVEPVAPPVDSKPIVQLSKKQRARLNTASSVYLLLGGFIAVAIIIVLLLTVSALPQFGNPDNPVINEVYTAYVEEGLNDTGAVNIVAGMILDYRAFDTLGESMMLFTACMGVVMLIREPKKPSLSRKAGEEETA